jgi:hypothetical protein
MGRIQVLTELVRVSYCYPYADTQKSVEAEREAALAVERAIYGDLLPVVPNLENRNNSAPVN